MLFVCVFVCVHKIEVGGDISVYMCVSVCVWGAGGAGCCLTDNLPIHMNKFEQ